MEVLLKTITGIIPANITEYTVTDEDINNQSIIEVYYDSNDVYTVTTNQTGNSITITTNTHSNQVGIKILINNVNVFSPYDDSEIRSEYEGLSYSLGAVIEDINSNIKPTLEEIIDSVDELDSETTTLENQLTANNTPIYLDYHDGKYGYNTDPNRGADTFNPFNEGGGGTPFEIVMNRVYRGYMENWVEKNFSSSPMPFAGKLILYASFQMGKGDYGLYVNGSRKTASFTYYHNTYYSGFQRYELNVNANDVLMYRVWGVGSSDGCITCFGVLYQE